MLSVTLLMDHQHRRGHGPDIGALTAAGGFRMSGANVRPSDRPAFQGVEDGGAGLRTPDTRIMIPLLWPTELHRHHAYASASVQAIPDGTLQDPPSHP
jgi:hypothetical protein